MYHCRKYPDSDDVSDILCAQSNGIKLFNMFSMVLILDSTYKTNKYHLLLLEFFGVTSTEYTFSIAFGYMKSEKEDKVSWALERCRNLLYSKYISTKVVVTDRNHALMNDVDIVFIKASALLCEYHIERIYR